MRKDYDEEHQKLDVFVVGAGNIGMHLIKLLQSNERNSPYRLIGYCKSQSLCTLSEDTLQLGALEPCPNVLEQLLVFLRGRTRRCVVVDCSASPLVPAHLYRPLLEDMRSHSLVLCNKIGLCGSLDLFRALIGNSRFEATVMAGVPVIHTIQSLRSSLGDRIVQIEAVLSGTLSFIFNTFCSREVGKVGGVDFGQIVQEAVERGYAEPDFWIDLSGLDVARKMLILARMMGLPMDLDDIKVAPVLSKPSAWTDEGAESIARSLKPFDAAMNELKGSSSSSSSKVLRYMGSITIADDKPGSASCSVRTMGISPSHPFSGLRGTDCAMLVKTEFMPTGILLQGPGAGRESTVFGILSDLASLI